MGERHAEAASAAAATADPDCAGPGVATRTASGAAAHAAAGADASAPTTLRPTAADLEFFLAVDVIYHRRQQALYASWHRWAMFISILLGTSAAGQLVPPLIGGLAVAAAAAFDLCFDLTGRASTHAEMARRYNMLTITLARALDDPARLNEVRDAWIEAGADAPEDVPVARLRAHNEAIESLGRDVAHKAAVPGLMTRLRGWLMDGGAH